MTSKNDSQDDGGLEKSVKELSTSESTKHLGDVAYQDATPFHNDLLINKLLDATTIMMNGDKVAAEKWIRSPLRILGNATPLSHAETE